MASDVSCTLRRINGARLRNEHSNSSRPSVAGETGTADGGMADEEVRHAL